jgi:hypothetical protein
MKIKLATLLLTLLTLSTPCYAWTGHFYPNDFDGDDISDLCVWRNSTGEWFCVPSSGQVIPGWAPVGAGPGSMVQWGLPGDKLVPGDYDNDGKTDAAVLRPGTMVWYIRYSSGGTAAIQFGLPGAIFLCLAHFVRAAGMTWRFIAIPLTVSFAERDQAPTWIGPTDLDISLLEMHRPFPSGGERHIGTQNIVRIKSGTHLLIATLDSETMLTAHCLIRDGWSVAHTSQVMSNMMQPIS